MNTLTAIELGSASLTAVTARINGQGAQIVHSGTAGIAALDGPSITAALEKCGVAEEARRQKAILLIPRGQALLRELELPESTPEELVPMVRFQVERELPLPLDQVRYSYVETGREGGKVRIQVVAVPRDVLDPALAALEAAGVKVSGAYISSFGLLALYRDGEPAALVEVAAGEAEILVVSQGRMEISRTAPLLDGPSAEFIAQEVDRTLLAYAARAPGREVTKVILAGEGAQAADLARDLGVRLSREVALAGPGDLETATVAGICLGLSRGAAIPDILNPPVAVRRFRLTRAHRLIGLAALALIGLVVWSQMAISDRVEDLRRKREQLKTQEPRAVEVQRRSQQTAVAHEWYRHRRTWIRMLETLAQPVSRENLWLSSTTIEDTGTVRLMGKAREARHVDDYVSSLTKTGIFGSVRIETVRDNSDRNEYRKDFTVNAVLAGAGLAGADLRKKK